MKKLINKNIIALGLLSFVVMGMNAANAESYREMGLRKLKSVKETINQKIENKKEKREDRREERQDNHAVFGKVTAINGNIVTLSETIKVHNSSTTATSAKIWTVDATNAKIIKNGATGTISSIAINDFILVNGDVNGQNIIAKNIHDGKGEEQRNKGEMKNKAQIDPQKINNFKAEVSTEVNNLNQNNFGSFIQNVKNIFKKYIHF